MAAVVDASEEIESFGGNFIIDKDLVFYEEGVYISVYDGTGVLIEGRRPAELAQLPDFREDVMQQRRDENQDVWYIYDSIFEVDGKPVWVRGIVKDFASQGTFSFMIRLSAIAFPALVLLAALGGYLITRRAFRPVRNVLDTVENITKDGDLSRRVDLDAKGAQPHGGKVSGRQKGEAESGDEIHKLAKTFNGMFDKLEKAFEKEKQFTSDVSHELRTPLAVIISQSDYAKEDEEYREKALDVINREARRMAGLVNRLLTLSRSDGGRLKLEKERIDFTGMCEMVAEQQSAVAAEKGIRLETAVHQGVFVDGDETMLIRVLLNLVDNAIKYGKEGGMVRITLDAAYREMNRGAAHGTDGRTGYACCAVADDGIGIAPEDLQRIWERFYRVDAARSEEGSGLGLSMVDALVKAHGGYTEVSSKLGEGSCFKVWLPLAEHVR